MVCEELKHSIYFYIGMCEGTRSAARSSKVRFLTILNLTTQQEYDIIDI